MHSISGRTLSGFFCDDIRHEVNGKVTLVGCYEGDLQVPEFPALLPRICAVVRVLTPMAHPLRQVRFTVMKDEEQLIEGLANLDAVESQESDGFQVQMMFAHFVISPLALEAPCSLRVRAHADGEELKGLGLSVRLLNAETA